MKQQPGLSRRRAQAAIEKGQVLVDGVVCRETGSPVTESMQVVWDANRPAAPRLFSSPFPVLYRDDHVIVVDKPAGVLSVPAHPGGGEEDSVLGRLLESQRQRFPQRKPFVGRVHRLDRDTSGALAFALDATARAGLIALFRDHRIDRRYLALVEGSPTQDEGSIDAPMADEWEGGRRRVALGDEARSPALTRYRVRERFPGGALLEVELETGRQHQIRVHLAHAGWPVLGDRVYRKDRTRAPLIQTPRQMLHAETLAFAHPVTGQQVSVTCPLPVDFRATLLGLRRRARASARKPRPAP